MPTRWNMRGAKQLERMFRGDRNLRNLMLTIGALYMGGMHERYVRASRTPGNPWQDLAPSTKRKRRRGNAQGIVSFAILRDTGLLLNALAPRGIRPSRGGQLRMISSQTVRAGFDQAARHPDTDFTFAELADVHQRGLGHVPPRPILVEPRTKDKRLMILAIKRKIEKVGDMRHGRR